MIPDSFQILGHTVEVKVDPKICEAAGADGLYFHERKMILLKTKKGKYAESVYWHEVFHCMLEHTGQSELSKDEDFIDRMGEALYQIISTSVPK